jgi:hypothetical protein
MTGLHVAACETLLTHIVVENESRAFGSEANSVQGVPDVDGEDVEVDGEDKEVEGKMKGDGAKISWLHSHSANCHPRYQQHTHTHTQFASGQHDPCAAY